MHCRMLLSKYKCECDVITDVTIATIELPMLCLSESYLGEVI